MPLLLLEITAKAALTSDGSRSSTPQQPERIRVGYDSQRAPPTGPFSPATRCSVLSLSPQSSAGAKTKTSPRCTPETPGRCRGNGHVRLRKRNEVKVSTRDKVRDT
jgi:hypothetical protein